MTIPRDLSNLAPGANTSGVLQTTKGGTALTTFTAANNALYSTSASALTAGTLPVAAGGSGATTLTGVLKGNGTSAFTAATAGTDYVAPGTATTFTATQNFSNSGITLKGSSTGITTFSSANASATNYTVTIPAATDTIATIAAPQTLTNKTINGSNNTITNVSLTTGVTGTLPTSNGGTNLTTFTAANNAIYSTSASALTAGTLPVAAGGTGATTLTANNVILGNGTSAVQFVAPGANGNVLASNGTSWVSTAAAGGGSMIYISTVTASGASTADFTSLSSTYDVYVVQAVTVRSDNNPDAMLMRIQVGGSWNNGPYYHGVAWGQGSNTSAYSSYATYSSGGLFMTNTNTIGSNSAFAFGFTMYIYAPSTTRAKIFTWQGGISGTPSYTATGSGSWDDGNFQTMTGIRFQMASGLIYGTFRLYGIKNS